MGEFVGVESSVLDDREDDFFATHWQRDGDALYAAGAAADDGLGVLTDCLAAVRCETDGAVLVQGEGDGFGNGAHWILLGF